MKKFSIAALAALLVSLAACADISAAPGASPLDTADQVYVGG